MKHKVVGGLSERIRETILASDVDITIAAKRMGISRSLLYGYMYYDVTPNAINLMKLAIWFNVSADWLLGISDTKQSPEWIKIENDKRDKKVDKEAVGESIMNFRKSKGMSRPKFGRCIGVGEKTVFNWETGRVVPTKSNLETLKNIGWEGIDDETV